MAYGYAMYPRSDPTSETRRETAQLAMNDVLQLGAASAAASTAARVHRSGQAPGTATPTALAVQGAQLAPSFVSS